MSEVIFYINQDDLKRKEDWITDHLTFSDVSMNDLIDKQPDLSFNHINIVIKRFNNEGGAENFRYELNKLEIEFQTL